MPKNLNPSKRFSFLAAFSGAKYKTGVPLRLFRPLFDKPLALNRILHVADMYLDILRQFGAYLPDEYHLILIIDRESAEQADVFWSANNVGVADKVADFDLERSLTTLS